MVRNRILGLIFSLTVALVSAAQDQEQTPPPEQPVTARLDASKVSEPISKYDFGMFIEHLGNIINHGLWSEMLDDRKFYYPVDSVEVKEPAGPATRTRFRAGPAQAEVL